MDFNGLTPDILQQLYLEEKLTQKQIADRFGTPQGKVSTLMRKWGLMAISKSDRMDFPPLTIFQHEVLFGSLLGDGTMSGTVTHTARFSEGHSVAQAEYTRWKAGVLEPYTSSIYETRKTDKNGHMFYGLSFSTHGCKALRPYYDLFYPDGVR